MTAQVSDIFLFEGKKYDLAGVNGELFIPEKWGLNPEATSSACWRGYVATYALNEDNLVLENLEIRLKESDSPEVNGVKPRVEPYNMNFYEDLNLLLNLTGGVLIAKGFIPELYVHMGFHPAWKYKEVHELIFQNGKLTEQRNVSEKLAEIRDKLADKPLKPDFSEMDISEWIQSTFRLDYEL